MSAFTCQGLVVYRAGTNQLGLGPRQMIAACHPHYLAFQLYRYDLTDHEGLLWQFAPPAPESFAAAEQRAALYDFHQFFRIWHGTVGALQAAISPAPLISNTSLAHQALVEESIAHGRGRL